MQRIIPAMLIIAALIHFIPVTGVLGEAHLVRLYGVPIQEPNLLILMQHRAITLGLVGVVLLTAAVLPAYRPLAYFTGLVSVTSFVLIAWSSGTCNASVARVVTADMVAAACLLVALAMDYLPARLSAS